MLRGLLLHALHEFGQGWHEARWECPPLPKDLGNIRNADPFWMTPDGPFPRKDCVCMPEHEKRWNFRMVPGHATVDEVLGKKEFWK